MLEARQQRFSMGLVLLFVLVGCSADVDDDTAGDDDTDTVCAGAGGYIQSQADLDAIAHCESLSLLFVYEQDWLTEIELPNLESVDGDLTIANNATLLSADLPRLESVSSSVGIHANPSLVSVDLSSLATVVDDSEYTSLDVFSNSCLTSLDVSALSTVEILFIYENDSLPNLDGLSGFTNVGWDLTIALNDCLSQEEAESFAAPLDVGDDVCVEDNGVDYPCE